MTMAPAAARRGASVRDEVAPVEQSAMSIPEKSAWPASSTSTSAVPPLDGRAGRPGRGEEPDLVEREGPLLEDRPHHRSDLAGCSDDGDRIGTSLGQARSSASRTPRAGRGPPARPPRSRTMHEIRMVEVEIMSMLMPLGGERLEHGGGHPGVGLHAGARRGRPGRRRRRDGHAGRPELLREPLGRPRPQRSRSILATVKEMSVVPCSDVFCTIMSTLTDRSARSRKSVAATPGPVGHAGDGDLGLRRVVGDRGDDGLLHRRILLYDPGPRLPGEARAHVQGHVVVAGELDRPQLEHPPAGRGDLQHLVEAEPWRAGGPSAPPGGRR